MLALSAGLLPVIPQPVEGRSGDESYELRIAADGSAEIKAEGRGRVWAEVTYAQLKAMGAAKPGLVVKDGPKYRVRAAMLDVARKFFPMDFLRDGDRKPRPSRGASRTGSLREGFRMIYRTK